MRVFISSVIGGMEDFRDAVARASKTLRHEVVRAEEFSATPESPRIACLRAARESDVTILIMGERYGDRQESGLSATHEEYIEASAAQRPIIIMVQKNKNRESAQREFLNEVRDWKDGHYTDSFESSEELYERTIGSLHDFELRERTGPVNPDEIIHRAQSVLAKPEKLHLYKKVANRGALQENGYFIQRHSPQGPCLAIGLASGPLQTVIRPAQMESQDFWKRLTKYALSDSVSLFSLQEGSDYVVDDGALILVQENRFVRVEEDGTVSFVVSLRSPEQWMSVIVDEEVTQQIERFARFSIEVLNHIDGSHRLSHCVIAAVVLNANYSDWRSRSSIGRNPNRMNLPRAMSSAQMQTVTLSPPVITRVELNSKGRQVVEDLTIQLRREFGVAGSW